MKAKGIVRIFNLLILLLCAASVASYVFFPFWHIDMNVKVTPEIVAQIFSESLEDIDASEIMAEDTDVHVGLTVNKEILLRSFTAKDSQQFVKVDFFPPILEEIAQDVDPVINEVASNTVKVYAKEEATKTVESIIAEKIGGEAATVMADLGITGEVVGEKVGGLIDLINTGDATVESVTDFVANAVEELLADPDGKYPALAGFEVDKEELGKTLRSAFEEFNMVNSGGKISTITDMMAALMTGIYDANINGTAPAAFRIGKGKSDIRFVDDPAPAEGDPVEGFADMIYEMFIKDLDQQTTDLILLIVRIVAGVALFSAAVWVWLVIKMLLKIVAKNPGIKVWPAVLFGWLPQLVFGYALTYGLKPILSLIGEAAALSEITTFLDTAQFASTTSGFYPSLIAAGLFVLSIFYGFAKRACKRVNKK